MSKLSIILPIYNEVDNLETLIDEIQQVMNSNTFEFEIIAVDDGSTDGSLKKLKDLRENDRSFLRIFSLRGNRGQSAAFDAGFRATNGDIVVTMDADGQNDPADIPRLVEKIEEGYDFATGKRKDRKDDFVIRRFPSLVANFIIRKVTGSKVTDLGCSLKAYKREIVEDLYLYGEMHRFISILATNLGASMAEIDVNHRPRMHGVSKYTLNRVFKVLFDLTTIWYFLNFHTKPSYIFGGLGIFSFIGSISILSVVAYQKFIQGFFVHRNPLFIIAAVLLIVAIQFVVFGLLAEVLVRTYFESQSRRPYSFKYQSDKS